MHMSFSSPLNTTQILLKLKKPSLYRVILLNDDFTPMDFVVEILRHIFHKTPPQAVTLMMEVHTKGQAICGTYSYEVAEAKVTEVTHCSYTQGYPLTCIMKKEEVL